MSQRAKIIARAWSDENFKKMLVTNPTAVLSKSGIKVSPNVTIKILEDTADTYHFVLPARPAKAAQLSGRALIELAEQYVPIQYPDTIPPA